MKFPIKPVVVTYKGKIVPPTSLRKLHYLLPNILKILQRETKVAHAIAVSPSYVNKITKKRSCEIQNSIFQNKELWRQQLVVHGTLGCSAAKPNNTPVTTRITYSCTQMRYARGGALGQLSCHAVFALYEVFLWKRCFSHEWVTVFKKWVSG